MKKFSIINENVDVYGFNSYQYSQIKKLIDSILHRIYETITIDDIPGRFVKTQDWEDKNRLKSILNYANTNRLLLIKLSKMFNLNSYNELYQFIKNNGEELFIKDNKYFNIVLEILKITEEKGIKNEKYALRFLENIFSYMNCKAIRTETDFYDDLILGVDIYFTVSGSEKTYKVQVKPLYNFEIKSYSYEIKTSGVVKNYEVDYYLFVNIEKEKIMMFRNRTTAFYENLYFFRKKDLFKVGGKLSGEISITTVDTDKELFQRYAKSKGHYVDLIKIGDMSDVDIYFYHNKGKYTIQSKTLLYISTYKSGEYYKAYINGDYTDIKSNYFILIPEEFSSKKYIFRGINVKIFRDSRGILYYSIPSSNLIYTED